MRYAYCALRGLPITLDQAAFDLLGTAGMATRVCLGSSIVASCARLQGLPTLPMTESS